MNIDKLIELLKKINNDIEHFKNKPHFIELIQNITKKENIVEKLLKEFENSLIPENDYSREINILDKYIKKFEKKYIKKIEVSDGIIYEYENEYKYYPNKKSSHIVSYFKDKFLKDNFDEIIIDNIKRSEYFFTKEILEDIKHSNTCFIIIKK